MTTFGFQSCDCDGVTCSLILKATGPSLCGFALVLILLSRSRSLINLTQLEYSADQRCYHSCSEQNSFAHFLIFGVLFCFSGMLLTTIGVWAVTCPGTMDGQGFNLTIKVNENEKCKLLFLQIMGPAVTFVGICFLLMAHVKRKVVLRPDEENTSTNDQQPCMPGPCQIATDSSGLVLPLPPPYFPEPPPMVNDSCEVNHPTPSDDPPPYYSVVFRSTDCASQMEQRNSNVEDFSVNVFSVTPCQSSAPRVQVSDGDKAGATLLFSGVFLVLVGITFTVMGWIKYYGTSDLEWTQLLGPILLSVGVTFVLIAVCKFRMLTCKTCKQINESAVETEQTPCGQSFVFTGINQPITFHGATVVQYIPPPYASPAQDAVAMNTNCLPSLNNTQSTNPPNCATGTTPSPPQYYSIYPLDSTAFTGDENCPPYQRLEDEIIRAEENQDDLQDTLRVDEVPDSIPPPSYDEIFPVESEDTSGH